MEQTKNNPLPLFKFYFKTKGKNSLLIRALCLKAPDGVKMFLVLIRNRLISGGLKPVLIHTKKTCLASYYIQFSTNIKMYFGTSGLKKQVLILKLYILYPRKVVYNTMREITIKCFQSYNIVS